ncbi:MAG: PTS sugar transporter subunit IIA [Candidatus Thiothrix putei]|jgi:Phosphotransferase system mannitol/fructose-specific IIA domain (Ntr-type)|uniref:PTS system, nitrogen regulatory IIA component n=2 Tax=Thiothrix TaxID=1030 RepID=A0A1H4EG48_9GAMM|nr:PTS sugar transporter subunit IIA [Thiothrix caldifontis]WGZ95792.1 MAG: PTS sugar transporter subunit IIA [Candidatus Thiothrix putei]SEA83817.1 PTS system, nitrogen regulatory IIA component [Thiothrix caldifontis]
MDMTTLLSAARIACKPDVSSKKRAFEQLAEMLALGQPNLEAEAIFDALTNREKLGSTAIGNGVAIPHACMSIHQPCGALLLLEDGVKMDTPDKKPVQLFMAILVPANQAPDYSELITQLTSTLIQKSLIEQICCYQDTQTMLDHFLELFDPPSHPFAGALAA